MGDAPERQCYAARARQEVSMRVCIFGAGAIGGYLGGKLAANGHAVSLLARGEHLKALRARGLRLETGGRVLESRPNVSDKPEDLGPQDVVIVSVKGPALPSVVRTLAPLLGPDTSVVFALNGIPWWFFHGFGAPHEGRTLKSVDPDGVLAQGIDPKRVLGCVVHIASSVPEPGFVRHASGELFIVGEPKGGETPRVQAIAGALNDAGVKTQISPRIQQDIWMKYLGNMTMGPISVLTGATLVEIAQDPGTRKLCADMMVEAIAAGTKLKLDPGMGVYERIDLGGSLGRFKSSMLQDFEKGRPLEIDTFLTVMLELAQMVDVPVPIVETVRALLLQKAKLAGVYK
jgi:2-dehydropantoate 2-reductase